MAVGQRIKAAGINGGSHFWIQVDCPVKS